MISQEGNPKKGTLKRRPKRVICQPAQVWRLIKRFRRRVLALGHRTEADCQPELRASSSDVMGRLAKLEALWERIS